MLVKFADLVDSLVIDREKMKANLESTKGLVFSQAVMLALVESGLSRDKAYRIVQRHALDAWDGKGHLRDLIAADSEVVLDAGVLEDCFSTERVAKTASVVFDRLSRLE